ncbi:hypothetical protein J19TS2_31100 [Cohnella xylanilytica]|uniref:hypothetical protein n=1 Tax=Cohnella xylanilytica TaxID=557555 RepID=UPI001B1D64EE|nr:hypothetical protein [Cohnella xylanilytica]GIO13555.1 hypothetical protein J19TS2_31100 [Cohnella xylanilytica]
MADRENEEHYQLYKLLAFAIQELSWFASERQVSDVLSLPHSERILTNRARMAVERIEEQNPHFFAGYIAYRSNCKYPQVEEASNT